MSSHKLYLLANSTGVFKSDQIIEDSSLAFNFSFRLVANNTTIEISSNVRNKQIKCMNDTTNT